MVCVRHYGSLPSFVVELFVISSRWRISGCQSGRLLDLEVSPASSGSVPASFETSRERVVAFVVDVENFKAPWPSSMTLALSHLQRRPSSTAAPPFLAMIFNVHCPNNQAFALTYKRPSCAPRRRRWPF